MEIRLPKLGEGAESGTVVTILVKEGDRVEAGQTLIELENEKAVAPIPAPAAGTVAKLRVKEGDKISVGNVIAVLDEAAAGASAAKKAAPKPQQARAQPVEEPVGEETEPVEPEADESATPAASPSLRKLARELGLDLKKIRGSERGGRIVMADVRDYIQRLQQRASAGSPAKTAAAAAPSPSEKIDFSKWGEVTKKPMPPIRQTISRRLWESWHSIPHVTQFDSADITALNDLRKAQAPVFEKKGVRLRYPGMCEGDPFYLVYFMRSDKIEWIWQFEVSPGGLDLIWSFDAGTQQRKIPELAAENLTKDELWYQPPK